MGNDIIKLELQGLDGLQSRIAAMISAGNDMRPLFVNIASIMHSEVEANFQAGGRDPQWPESERVKKHGGQTLIDSAQLISSIQEFVTGSSTGVSTNKAYAAIHNFGGDIERKPHHGSVRLRTDAKGNLLRQSGNNNLAVFAKSSHKRAMEKSFSSEGWIIHMPQREFMKISDGGIGKIEAAAMVFFAGGG